VTISSRKFNYGASKAKKDANRGPVFITDRDQPSHVLLCISDYRQLTGGVKSMATLLAIDEEEEIIFSAPKVDLTERPMEFG